MPVLKDFRQTKEISLSAYPESKIEIYDRLYLKDLLDLKFGQESSNEDNLLYVIRHIKSWNFTDELENVLAITTDNIKMLDIESFTELTKLINEYSNQVKKNS